MSAAASAAKTKKMSAAATAAKAKRVYFIRHGQSVANQRKCDSPAERDATLTELGRQQAACWHAPGALDMRAVICCVSWARPGLASFSSSARLKPGCVLSVTLNPPVMV